MQSVNFEFLRPYKPELASIGGLAEAYAYPDPESALVKLRNFAEILVSSIYNELSLPTPIQANLYDLLNETSFKKSVPPVVINKLHSLRVHGNKAAHGDKSSSTTALWILEEAFNLTSWYIVAF